MLLDQGEPALALVHCEEAVRLRPGLPSACQNLGHVLDVLGRLDEARASLLEAIRLKPDMAAAHASLGGVLEQIGEIEQSRSASLRSALPVRPRHTGALAPVGDVHESKALRRRRTAIEDLWPTQPCLRSGGGRCSLDWPRCSTPGRF